MTSNKNISIVASAMLLGLLTACGGGGSSSDPATAGTADADSAARITRTHTEQSCPAIARRGGRTAQRSYHPRARRRGLL